MKDAPSGLIEDGELTHTHTQTKTKQKTKRMRKRQVRSKVSNFEVNPGTSEEPYQKHEIIIMNDGCRSQRTLEMHGIFGLSS